MVSGVSWPGGDPFLQRQNEPSIAASTRNPLHLLAGANDYRSVDLPAVALPKLEETEEHGDAWLGLFESFDGGQTWQSNLLPGCPYKGCGSAPFSGKYEAASDPVVRAGTNGLFYYSGIAFQRDQSAGSVFVARYIDNNNKENGDPIQYLGTSVVASGNAQTFLDKPWIAVDVPREGALTCSVSGQSFFGGNVYITYAGFPISDESHAAILFSRSRDCGVTWSTPLQIAPNTAGNQGPTFAIDPINGSIYLAWRQFATSAGSIWVAKSTNGGASFGAPVKVADLTAFDQATSENSFRTNAYPAITTDANGRVYMAWSDRVGPSGAEGCGSGACARIVVSSSTDGQTWTSPQLADPSPAAGHQWMPALTYAGGMLSLVYYDSRNDHEEGVLVCPPNKTCISDSDYVEQLVAPPPKENDPLANVFTPAIDDQTQLLRRHTIDVRVTQSPPLAPPETTLNFAYPSTQVTQYLFGSSTATSGTQPIEQLRYNPPNLPMFDNGTEAFLGDYIDVTPTPAFVPVVTGTRSVWRYNVSPSTGSVVQTAWTDNRDVIPPPDQNWTKYTPPEVQSTSIINPSKQTPVCSADDTGTRNQNVYTARVAAGVVAGSPGNTKPLSVSIERGFVVFVENTSTVDKTYRLSIPSTQQPAGGYASFVSKSVQPAIVTQLDVVVPALSSISRTVFVTASNASAQINISVTQITGLNGNPVPTAPGTQATIQLNPDLTNPDLTNPDLTNPNQSNQNVQSAEIYNPDLTNLGQTNPDLTNPDLTNPDLTNPDLTNHEITNPDLTNNGLPNPDLTNPDLTNPDLTNQSITTPDLTNGSISDTFYTITNDGNTAAAYSIKLLLKGQIPAGIQLQLLLYRVYTVPAAEGCTLYAQPQNQLIANIPNPVFATTPDLTNPDLTNGAATNATLSLAPGETARIDLRTASPSKKLVFDPRKSVTVVSTAQAVNTNSIIRTIPPVASSGVTILPIPLPDGVSGAGFTAAAQIARYQGGPVTWALTAGSLPPTLALVPATGAITGTIANTTVGTYNFTLTATDTAHSIADTGSFTIRVGAPLTIQTASPLPAGTVGTPYSQTLSASGGLGAYSWAITFNSLPPGLTLNAATGVISGTPTTAGVSVFRVAVADSSSPNQTAEKYPVAIRIN